MCGIVAIYRKPGCSADLREGVYQHAAAAMLESLHHRGPDERTLVTLDGVMLGHTRLSIIDLDGGTQPIFNEDRTVAVLLNGEIYDYREHRAALLRRGHQLRTSSDTEVIAHLYEEHGEAVFEHLNGMFAVVIYDQRDRSLVLARDRLGEKPLVYWESPELFIVTSEIKALLRFPQVSREIDPEALRLYFNSLYVPAPYSIFKGIHKLPPGHVLRVGSQGTRQRRYWRLERDSSPALSDEQIVERFVELFADSVERRLVADVPVGVLLSGGVDSSAVTALAAQRSQGDVRTFSVGFAGAFDERPFAREVATRYRTQHHEVLVDFDVEEAFARVMSHFDEPFGDSSAIPVYLVTKVAREHVKVMLTGDGGDELFAGYLAYLDQQQQAPTRLATGLRQAIRRYIPGAMRRMAGLEFAQAPDSARARSHWSRLRSYWFDDELDQMLGQNGFRASRYFEEHRQWLERASEPLSFAFSWDMSFYLPDDLLKKLDMASMLVSVECRAPFLDHRVVEFCFQIPPERKLQFGHPKYLLKRALEPHLPAAIVQREKRGFGAPVQTWLEGPLAEPTRDLLGLGCRAEGFLPRTTIDQTLRAVYERGEVEDFRVPHRLWQILSFEWWLRTYYGS